MPYHRRKTDEQQDQDIDKLYDHARVANEEMGVIKTDISWIKGIIEKMDKRVEGLDSRIWYILTAIVLSILVQIALKLYFK